MEVPIPCFPLLLLGMPIGESHIEAGEQESLRYCVGLVGGAGMGGRRDRAGGGT